MLFCKNCENMLYIELNEDDPDSINYYCRACGTKEDMSNTSLVLNKTVFKNSEKDFNTYINKYSHLDPTLPRTNKIDCINNECTTNTNGIPKEIIYIRYDEINISYVYLCSTCKTVWKIEK